MLTIGVAFIHLIADAAENLPQLYPDYRHLGLTLAACGVVLVLALETVSKMIVNPTSSKNPDEFGVLLKTYLMEFSINLHR